MYQSRYLLKALSVGFIKCIQIPAVNVDKSNYIAPAHIGNDDAFLALPRRPAHSPAERNTAASFPYILRQAIIRSPFEANT